MTDHSICAVIVTYHPTIDMLDNIAQVLKQVSGLVVVDNGSSESELTAFRQAAQSLGFKLIENGDNLGIAEALNRGILWARSKSFFWVILFDQDSIITEGFVNQMLASYSSHAMSSLVASMHPRYADKITGVETPMLRAKDGGPVKSLTSGALMPTWIFDKIGYFASEYFIDEVDSEFCYRIRSRGYLIAESGQAVLHHTVGQPRKASFFGFTCLPTNHSPTRRYYMSRNRVALLKTYFHVFPAWIMKYVYETARETLKSLLVEDDRLLKLRNVCLGILDGVLGKMGKRAGI